MSQTAPTPKGAEALSHKTNGANIVKTKKGINLKFTKTTKIDASAETVWTIFAHGFDDAYKWMAVIPNSYGKDNGHKFEGATSAGRVCETSTNPSGLKASEKFLAYDEAAKTCTILIEFVDTPMFFPIYYNSLDFSLTSDGDGGSIITWDFRSKIKPWYFLMWPLIRTGAPAGIGRIGEELKHYAETGEPHPRKVKATKPN